jgi:hypothetical protein
MPYSASRAIAAARVVRRRSIESPVAAGAFTPARIASSRSAPKRSRHCRTSHVGNEARVPATSSAAAKSASSTGRSGSLETRRNTALTSPAVPGWP